MAQRRKEKEEGEAKEKRKKRGEKREEEEKKETRHQRQGMCFKKESFHLFYFKSELAQKVIGCIVSKYPCQVDFR